tara:strand:- start:151 stop:414 length:264 start_codon:yes stop_codon:yes gene_type:complete
MNSESRFEFSASLKIIYFGVGFTLSAAVVAVLLTIFRPIILAGGPWIGPIAMLAPILVGLPFGLRVMSKGAGENLRLLPALKRALRP